MMEYLSPEDGWQEIGLHDDESLNKAIDILAEKNVFHQDMHFHNVLVNKFTNELKIIDLDGMNFRSRQF